VLTFAGFEHSAFLLYDTLAYQSTSTNVGSNVLNLLSDEDSPTSLTFAVTSSSNIPLFSVGQGSLYGHDIKFLYDSSAVDVFISLSGGLVIMEYVTVTGTNSGGSVSAKSFVSLSEGTVELTQFSFEDFQSSVSVVMFNGPGTLLLDEISVTNVTFAGSGSLISSESGIIHLGKVNILNSNLSLMSTVNLNGSVIRLNGTVSSIYIYNSTFVGCNDLGNGGALFILHCEDTVINSSSFNGYHSYSSGKGGAAYFGERTSFRFYSSSFENCSALYGGAVYSESELSSLRYIENVSFVDNSVYSGGNGNDIADNSTVAPSIYTLHSVINSLTNSISTNTVSNFYLLQQEIDLDCFISTVGCGYDPTYVKTSGVDSEACGSLTNPCHSISQGVNNLKAWRNLDIDINVGSGEYTDTRLEIALVRVVVLGDVNNKPVLSLLSPPIRMFNFCLYACKLLCCIFDLLLLQALM
jgi:hypothetical protein